MKPYNNSDDINRFICVYNPLPNNTLYVPKISKCLFDVNRHSGLMCSTNLEQYQLAIQ